MKRSTLQLIFGIMWVLLSLLMVFCIVINCLNQNLVGIPIAVFAAVIDAINAGMRFADYKRYRAYEKELYK